MLKSQTVCRRHLSFFLALLCLHQQSIASAIHRFGLFCSVQVSVYLVRCDADSKFVLRYAQNLCTQPAESIINRSRFSHITSLIHSKKNEVDSLLLPFLILRAALFPRSSCGHRECKYFYFDCSHIANVTVMDW